MSSGAVQSTLRRIGSLSSRSAPRMRLAALGLSLILLAAGAGGCGGGDDLTVFAAISLRRPLEEIASAFETQHPDIDVSFSFAGSQWLRFQLEEGARASVFISADDRQMELLAESGLIDGRALVFGRNRLAVAVPEGNPARLETLEDLASPGLRLVWAQEGVPLGAYSRQALAALADRYGPDFPQRVEANVISGEANAEAVTGKVELGEADAAIVYETDARRLEREGATVISIPDVYQPEVSFFAAALRETERLNLARDFVTFLRSAEAQAILIDHGFLGVR